MTPLWTLLALEIASMIGLLAFTSLFTLKAYRKYKAEKNKKDVIGGDLNAK